MNRRITYLVALLAGGGAATFLALWLTRPSTTWTATEILKAYGQRPPLSNLEITHPLENAVYPPDLAPPLIRWKTNANANLWLVQIRPEGTAHSIQQLTERPEYELTSDEWHDLLRSGSNRPIELQIFGVQRSGPETIQAAGSTRFSISSDPVTASIFYREVNLPFKEAVKDPSKIRWRFGSLSSPSQPPVVLENLPVCGNCHSFSQDGSVLGMDVDYANSKGSYVVTQTRPDMTLATTDIISWNDYGREDGQQTFGLLSQVSPDGNLVVSTVKDRSVFVATEPLAFSQLFFPVKGILAIYNRQTGEFLALPGADDPRFVQSNPVWSPDGESIVFARTVARELNPADKDKILLTPEEVDQFLEENRDFKYSLYSIPYNQGQGGTPEPLEGASDNGKSNYFPRFSPDGQWIVFCQADNYMLLQPDSTLWILPSTGGQARQLNCNTTRMNSWHSFSPNGRWLVFSSKAYSDYTQLFLTHFDKNGHTSPPIWLHRLTSPDRAANIPEFVNLPADGISRIGQDFLDDYSFVRSGDQFYRGGDPDGAIDSYKKALALNPNSVQSHIKLGFLLYHVKQDRAAGKAHTQEALRLDPNSALAHFDYGYASLIEQRPEEAVQHLSTALRLAPNGVNAQYSAERMNHTLAQAYLARQGFSQAIPHLQAALAHSPSNAGYLYQLAITRAAMGDLESAIREYQTAIDIMPSVDTSPHLHRMLAAQFAANQRFPEAVAQAEKSVALARAAGQIQLASYMMKKLEDYLAYQR